VHRDFSDITLDNRYFAVDTKLRGDRVEVRFDPFQIAEQLNEVDVFSLDGAFLGIGRLYQRERGFHEQPTPPAPRGPIEASYIEALQAGHESSHEQRRQQGLDFHSASQRNVWPLTSFATLLAKLLGREGGLSSLSPEELNALEAFHRRHNRVQETLVRQAVARSETTSIAHVLLELQSLLSDGGS
jgi:hypothetical protein